MATAKMKTRQHEPSFGRKLGLRYIQWTLDCIVTIAHAVSKDFSYRPELYQKIRDDAPTKLTELQGRYGFDPNFPDMNIRNMLMNPIFGKSDGYGNGNDGSDFQRCRLRLVAAAADFAENVQPTGYEMLRARVRSAGVIFITQMVDLEGDSFDKTNERMESIFGIAKSIIRNPDVFGVFGVTGSIDPRWPDEPDLENRLINDTTGAKVIEKMTTQLPDLPCGVISREMFTRMQRIAEKGFQSIRIIIDENIEDPNYDIDALITALYAWGSDLGLIGGARPQQQAPLSQAQYAIATRTVAGT